jgi:hypothetical protein
MKIGISLCKPLIELIMNECLFFGASYLKANRGGRCFNFQLHGFTRGEQKNPEKNPLCSTCHP